MNICVVLVDRANYGRLKPVMAELRTRPGVRMQVVCAGTMLLDRFGKAKQVVEADGFPIDEEVYLEIDGSLPATMTKSIGLGIIEFSSVFRKLDPDFVLLIGDRYEALAAAIAAVYQNLCLIHLQGGEVTGSIDEATRHAITKLAHYHFPATRRSGRYIVRMGERPETVFPLGCPSADVVAAASGDVPAERIAAAGVGAEIDFGKPYLLTLFHPVTTEFAAAEDQMNELLAAVKETGMQIVLLWPNIDAGADSVSGAIRRFREFNRDVPLHAFKNFEPEDYVPLLRQAACCVGNSSSFVREASFLGTPVVLVGSRQDGREWSGAVKRVEPIREAIAEAIAAQLAHGRYPPSGLYGKPGVSARIADKIATLRPYGQKRLAYGKEKATGV
ncbi:UDP-N-acetylglucosamine 2-epimerase [Cohnella massiliensis]|uniref:UDP-N-acetylglucosamine 2-epimerase n=1 Tax=Cohnella massiliensis TaxID=1816691 RepID=UPI0009BBA634|nr:UDP-N-acetylglucosamine 2-epimerase [Cohnella massiliensis]